MPKPEDTLPTLFRSLGPDDANFQATMDASAQEAEQRWPLFRAVAPKKSELTPALSPQERMHWSSPERPSVGECRPALSLPGLSDKLAISLGKLSAQTSAEVARLTTQRSPEEQPSEAQHSAQTSSQKSPADYRSSLFPRPQAVDQKVEVKADILGLFNKIAAKPVVSKPDLPRAARSDDSLANIFNRLEPKETVVSKPAERRSSFLDRLGKR